MTVNDYRQLCRQIKLDSEYEKLLEENVKQTEIRNTLLLMINHSWDYSIFGIALFKNCVTSFKNAMKLFSDRLYNSSWNQPKKNYFRHCIRNEQWIDVINLIRKG